MDDLRTSIRQLLKTPGFTLAAAGVLALGIGLNSAMFSIVHAMAFAARPFPHPEQLVQLYSRDSRTGDYRAFSYPTYQEIAKDANAFAGVIAFNPTIVGIGEGAESRRTFSMLVSANYFDVLAVPLLQGRGFTAEEDRPGQNVPVVVATYAFWKRTGFDPALLGKTIRINERPFTVVGITPQGFTGTMTVFGPELFFPLGVFDSLSNDFGGETARTLARADAYNLFLVARMHDDSRDGGGGAGGRAARPEPRASVSRRARASVALSHRGAAIRHERVAARRKCPHHAQRRAARHDGGRAPDGVPQSGVDAARAGTRPAA